MGLDCENAGWLCFDLETVALPDAAIYDTDPIEAPANYKDPVKIEAYLNEKRQQRLDRAALNIDLAQIVAIGYQAEGWAEPLCLMADVNSERRMLESFWEHVRSGTRLVGFNILKFDLCMLLRRSLYLGVPTPGIEVSRHNRHQIVDLYQRLSFDGLVDGHSLEFYCKRFGIPSDDTVTGKDIGHLVAAGGWAKVEHHCRSDVRKTVALAQRLGLIGATAEGAF